ncbi:MAG: Hpt domain-containing protein [Opitutaceae bacterium]|nr:Hpt domain-containing protein [Opitutaceae bacterium]
MSDFPIIDPASIENLRALNPGDNDEFLREIVGIYLDDTPLRIGELESSLAGRDMEKFVRAAHSIKGSSANLGAMALRAVAERLEHHARKHGWDDAPAMVGAIKEEFALVRTELEKITAGG